MTVKNIDEYIKKSEPFAQPILIKLRAIMHKACPDVVEAIKWGMPAFDYMGPLCNMAAFKKHCVFGFWKEPLLKDPGNFIQNRAMQDGGAMGHFGRITTLKELPPDKVIIDLIKQSMQLNKDGIKVAKKKPAVIKEADMPEVFVKALAKNKKAKTTFENFPPSAKKDYIEWITDAKTDATRDKRLATTMEWLAEGKRRNWKYEAKV